MSDELVKYFKNHVKCEQCGSFMTEGNAEVLNYDRKKIYFCDDRCTTSWFMGDTNDRVKNK